MWKCDRPNSEELGRFFRGILAVVRNLHPAVVGEESLNIFDTELGNWAREEGISEELFGYFLGEISNEMRRNDLYGFYPEVYTQPHVNGEGLVLYAQMMPKS